MARRHRVDERPVLVVAAIAGVAAAFSDASPTGTTIIDAALTFCAVAFVVILGVRRHGRRVLPVGRFPYLVFYVFDDAAAVWRVLHTRRDIPSAIADEPYGPSAPRVGRQPSGAALTQSRSRPRRRASSARGEVHVDEPRSGVVGPTGEGAGIERLQHEPTDPLVRHGVHELVDVAGRHLGALAAGKHPGHHGGDVTVGDVELEGVGHGSAGRAAVLDPGDELAEFAFEAEATGRLGVRNRGRRYVGSGSARSGGDPSCPAR